MITRVFLFLVLVVFCFGGDETTELFFTAEEPTPHWVEVLGVGEVALSWHPQAKGNELEETLSFRTSALRGAVIRVFKREGSSDKLRVVATVPIPSEGLGKKVGVDVAEGFKIKITIVQKK